MVARLSKEKDHITFLKSLKLLRDTVNFHATILGSGELYNEIKADTIYYYIVSFFKSEFLC